MPAAFEFMKTQHTPGTRHDFRTGQFFPTVNGKDISPTSFEASRALEIAVEACRLARIKDAAPELLEALKWAIRELCEAWDEAPEKAIPPQYLAALARATGEAK